MPDKTLTKRGVQLKALDDAGHGLARIATLSAIDHDNDTYAPGAFAGEGGKGQWVQILAAHDWSRVSLGKARVYEDGDAALAELHLNLGHQAGRDWHAALKFDLDGCCEGAPPVQEWSYGFAILDSSQETRDGERVRVLKRLEVFEVSPVVRGAGLGTGTLAIKTTDQPRAFGDQIDAAIALAADCLARARAVKDMRSEEGRALSATRARQLADLAGGLGTLVREIEAGKEIARRQFAAHHARGLSFAPRRG
jgi:phage head maturation protease